MTNVNDRHYVATYAGPPLAPAVKSRAEDFAADLENLYDHEARRAALGDPTMALEASMPGMWGEQRFTDRAALMGRNAFMKKIYKQGQFYCKKQHITKT